MSNQTDMQAVAAALRGGDRFVVTSHEAPDGDALGSLLATGPALRQLGKGVVMFPGRLAIAQERLVSSLLRMRLLAVLNPAPREQRPRVLFATLPGEPHELGLIGAALQAYEAGMPVLYLGTELPAAEIARVAEKLGVAGVALSSVDPQPARPAPAEPRQLRPAPPPRLPVSLCGEMASDPALVGLLVGLGLTDFSMTPGAIPIVRQVVEDLSAAEARRLAGHALRLATAGEIEHAAPAAEPEPG